MKFILFCFFISLMAQAQAPLNKVFVKLKDGQKLPESSLIKKSKNLFGQVYMVETGHPLSLIKSLEGKVEYAELNRRAEKSHFPKIRKGKLPFIAQHSFNEFVFNDPKVSNLWAFSGENGMNVTQAYQNLPEREQKEIVVAVVDTGIDYNHEDLKDNMWVNTNEIPNNGIDDDFNGYVDDVYGINPLVKDENGETTTDPMASHYHGTHVAGTIGAVQNNGIGVAGVANKVKLMAIRTVPDAADETDADIVESFLYAAKMGAKVINCSFGKKENEGGLVVEDTIKYIGEIYGVLVVAAAGNDSWGPFAWHDIDKKPKYPASFKADNLMVVASTKNSGGLSFFSNVGLESVHIAAPGSDIYSTVNNNEYGSASGTSMASPNTAGVAALVLSYFPDLSPKELRDTLMNSRTLVVEFTDKMQSGGRVNAQAALEYAKANF